MREPVARCRKRPGAGANYHGRAKLMDGKAIIVPAYDTALVGTPEEKQLLAARDELANAMAGR